MFGQKKEGIYHPLGLGPNHGERKGKKFMEKAYAHTSFHRRKEIKERAFIFGVNPSVKNSIYGEGVDS